MASRWFLRRRGDICGSSGFCWGGSSRGFGFGGGGLAGGFALATSFLCRELLGFGRAEGGAEGVGGCYSGLEVRVLENWIATY